MYSLTQSINPSIFGGWRPKSCTANRQVFVIPQKKSNINHQKAKKENFFLTGEPRVGQNFINGQSFIH